MQAYVGLSDVEGAKDELQPGGLPLPHLPEPEQDRGHQGGDLSSGAQGCL